MQQLILIRGLPGSGKSTIAKQLAGFEHYEADMFHMKNGEYCFQSDKVKDAHNWCKQETFNALVCGKNVVVSNTFTRYWEMQDYFEMAKTFGIKPLVIVANGDFENVHNVPKEVIEAMRNRWEN